MSYAIDLRTIRAIGGTQARGFEHLCYQLRELPPEGWSTTKTGDPDGGVEWYDTAANGEVAGFQCKYVWNVADLIKSGKASFDTVAGNLGARDVRTLTFLIPFDLSDQADITRSGKEVVSARSKWNQAVQTWRESLIPGTDISVRIRTEGWILQRLFEPGNEGRVKYFFDRERFSREWFQRNMRQAVDLADERYTPQSNVDLVIGRDIDALRLPPAFMEAMELSKSAARMSVQAVHSSAAEMPSASRANSIGADATVLITSIRSKSLSSATAGLAEPFVLEDLQASMSGVVEIEGLLNSAWQKLNSGKLAKQNEEGRAPADSVTEWQRTVTTRVGVASSAVSNYRRLCQSPAAASALSRVLLITGAAGQGKTHLLVDSSRRAMDHGGFGVCILGETLDAGRDILTQVAELLGLGALPHDVLLETLSSAAQTTSDRLLIAIDALNESDCLDRWPTKLAALVASLKNYPDLALVVSCRSDLESVVLPPRSQRVRMGMVERVHPGFLGRELEALEAYFSAVPNAWAKAPLLQPDFSSPLFVKLYAAGFEGLTPEQTARYDRHRSAVFKRFIESRVDRINVRLRLDPGRQQVERALSAFEMLLSETGTSRLPHSQANDMFRSFVPERTEWPATLMGMLLSEGVLTRTVLHVEDHQEQAVQFSYQALGDYRIGSAALSLHSEEIEAVRNGAVLLPAGSHLRIWYAGAARNIRQAFIVLFAEATGCELVDSLYSNVEGTYAPFASAEVRMQQRQLHELLSMTVETLPHRQAASVTERTIALGNLTSARRRRPKLWDSALAVAAEPNHILNADRLHGLLAKSSRIQRDQFWIPYTWQVLDDDTSPILRLIRWAEQTPTPCRLVPGISAEPDTGGTDPEVIRLASTVMIWLFTSSNRFIRDRVTKAVVQLLLGSGSTLVGLLHRFLVEDVRKIDDVYLTQRLVVATYGWMMRVGKNEPEMARTIGEFMRDHVLAPASIVNSYYPDVLTRDAAQGIVELAAVLMPGQPLLGPPYISTLPRNPPKKSRLRELYPRDPKDPSHSWGSLHSSIFGLGDFGTYEIEPAVRSISRKRRNSAPAVLPDQKINTRRVKRRWTLFLDSLGPVDRETAERLDTVDLLDHLEFLSGLNENQRALFNASSKRRKDAPKTISVEWARRWVFSEVARLGWTPEVFTDLERNFLDTHHDREGHKAERIGKKYQWNALHRLIAKLLDNHYFTEGYGGVPHDYVGVWQLGMRDIDPSLPPAYFDPPNYYETGDENEWTQSAPPDRINGSTFNIANASYWDVKPRALPDLANAPAWVTSTDDMPSLDERLVRVSPGARRWIVVSEYATHSAPSSEDSWHDGRAEEWSHIYGWLVKTDRAKPLAQFLETTTLMGRWMPEGGDRTRSYLGEAGWSRSWANLEMADLDNPDAKFGPEVGERVRDRSSADEPAVEAMFVLPVAQGYLWESSTSDCSIEESVSVTLPSSALLVGPSVVRHPDKPEWYVKDELVAAHIRFVRGTTRGSMLVLDEEWLISRLAEEGWEFVAGLLGERRLISESNKSWQQFDHIAYLAGGQWHYGLCRGEIKHAYRRKGNT